jgi:hypothetical protein
MMFSRHPGQEFAVNHAELTERFLSILGDLGSRRIDLDLAGRMLDRLDADARDNSLPFVRPSREALSQRILGERPQVGATQVGNDPKPAEEQGEEELSSEKSSEESSEEDASSEEE